MTEIWSPLVLLAIGLEVAVSVVALLIFYSPLSWRFSKTSLSIPVEAVELANHTHEVMSKFSFRVEPKEAETLIPQVVEILKCPICGISGSGLAEHLVQSGHGQITDSKTAFVTKLGSPFDIQDTPTAGVYRLVLKSGDALPKWADENRPIRIDIEGDTIVYWVKFDGLRHIK